MRSAALEHRFLDRGEIATCYDVAVAHAETVEGAASKLAAWAQEKRLGCDRAACSCRGDPSSFALGKGVAATARMRWPKQASPTEALS